MKGLNRVELIGNVGKEPEMRFTATGKAVTSFTMATSHKYHDDRGELVENTQWHNIIVWDKLAENCNQSLFKGSAVYVSGRLDYRSWDGNDGQKHYKTEIIAQDVIFLDKPKSNGPDKVMAAAIAAGGEPIKQDDLPF